ncbi:MAG: hypothetical protein AAF225_05275, partial [Pseudomonadota bacterium]
MDERRVLLIVGGGIAAYKSLELARELGRRGVAMPSVVGIGFARTRVTRAADHIDRGAVAIGVFDAVKQTVVVAIGIRRIGD